MHIQALIQSYGYWGILIALCVEYIGIPFPAETILTFSGIEWASGTFTFLPLYLSVVFGTFSGTLAAYFIGFYLGRPVIERFGKYVGITKTRIDQADRKFQKYTVPLLIFSRFVAGVRVITPYLAGMNRTSIRAFMFYSLLGSAVWALVFLLIGRFLGHAWMHYSHMLHRFIVPIVVLAIAAVIGGVLLKAKKKRQIHLST